MLEPFNESNSKMNHKEYSFEIKSSIVSIQRTNYNGYPLSKDKALKWMELEQHMDRASNVQIV
jgi:hypothetical protein